MRRITLGLLLVGLAFNEYTALAGPGLDDSLACEVIKSNDAMIPVGATAIERTTLRDIAKHGVIAFRASSNDVGLIDFYGPIEIYEMFAPGSGIYTLATDPMQPRELQGTLFTSTSRRRCRH